jgi:hypothetical protein
MRRARPPAAVLGLAVLATLLTACGGGHDIKATPADRDCAAVTQAANAIQIVDGNNATAADATRTAAAASALTSAAAAATTDVAGPAGQLAVVARAYSSALTARNVEGINVNGGLLRQRAQAVADACNTVVLGVAPSGPTAG